MPGNCVPVREGGEQPEARRAVRNEDEAHPMSPEKTSTVEPSLFNIGEGCQDWTLANPAKSGRGHNDHRSSHRHGGVGGRGMRVQVVDVRDEISGDGPRGPTAGAGGQNREARLVGGEVGAVHSNAEAANHRGAKGPHLVEENSEAKDRAMVPIMEIKTPAKVQQLQRTLYRKAKENGRWRAWSLYGDLWRRDVLEAALVAVVRNAGAAGVDGVTTEQVKAAPSAILDGLQMQLRTRSYRPSPVLRVWISKDDGKQRPDKVLLAAVLKRSTSVTNGWLARRLGMGRPASASQFVRRLLLDKNGRAPVDRLLSTFKT